jgi:ABC-type multidrug transport system fused ATPase/permease subunit
MISDLFQNFLVQQTTNITLILILSLVFSFGYTNLSALVNANIIQAIQNNNIFSAESNYKYFILITVFYLVAYYLYKRLQNTVLTNLAHWTKSEILKIILKANDEHIRNVNFVEFITPITRISNSCTTLLMEILCGIIPTFGFLFVILGYFLYKNKWLALGFLLGNIAIFVYIAYFWKDMFDYKQKQEEKTVKNERYILDILNNIEKVIHKGETANEINIYEKRTQECVDFTIHLMNFISNHTFIMNSFVYITLFGCLWYMIQSHKIKSMDTVTFITFLSILFMYEE